MKVEQLLLLSFVALASGKRPNIIVNILDDVGFNDFGYNHNTDTKTPNLDSLAMDEGVILHRFYTQPICTPARAALMTGRYPMRYGLHNRIVDTNTRAGLSLTETLLPSILRDDFGYSTHLIGKWHLGHFQWEYTPRYRGFDTFNGFLNGYEHYYTHVLEDTLTTGFSGMDLRSNESPDTDPDNLYGPYWKRNQLFSLLDDLETSDDPFFITMAWQASHTPLEAPDEYVNLYADQETRSRKITQAQTTCFDDVIGEVVKDLKDRGLWEDTLLFFASDNGPFNEYGDSAPFRGYKTMLWEGGVRTTGFVTGGYLNSDRIGKRVRESVHITDFAPTILEGVLGADPKTYKEKYSMDGNSVWGAINEGSSVDDYGDDLMERPLLMNIHSYLCQTTIEFNGESKNLCGAVSFGNWKLVIGDHPSITSDASWNRDFTVGEDILGCGKVPFSDDELEDTYASCLTEGCIYDLGTDPCEYYNVKKGNEEIYHKLLKLLVDYADSQSIDVLIGYEYTANTDECDVVNPDNSDGYWYPFDGYAFECDDDGDCEWTNIADFEVALAEEKSTDSDSDSDVATAIKLPSVSQLTVDRIRELSLEKKSGIDVSAVLFKISTIAAAIIVTLLSLFAIALYLTQRCGSGTRDRKSKYSALNTSDDDRTTLYGTA